MLNNTVVNILSPDEIADILNSATVSANKEKLSAQHKVDFSIELSESIKTKLGSALALDLSQSAAIPMRWIKGDTPAHKDKGKEDFSTTYLVYLTDSVGQLIVDGQTYAIAAGDAHIFSEGLEHSTMNTENVERLMIGPMSETGFHVGVAPEPPIAPICFAASTPIQTDQGVMPIEKVNSDLHTINNKKVVAITKTVSLDKYLVCFEKDAIGDNVPSEKTVVSKNHLIYNNGQMIKAVDFVGKYRNVHKIKYDGDILYNVLLEKYDKILVNNLICETLHPRNAVAKWHNSLSKLSVEEQTKIVKMHNDKAIQRHNWRLKCAKLKNNFKTKR
jgi:hypothetical protein